VIDSFLQHEIDVGSFPGAVWLVGSFDTLEAENALGYAVAVPLRLRASLDTIYDCASLTKPLITTTLFLQGVAEGRFDLEGSFHGYPYRRLLTHTSGLAAWLPLYASGDYLKTILEKGPEYQPGTKVVYSDLNMILLYFALGDYVRLANERIFRRLALHDAMFGPPAGLKPRIAATEWGQRWEEGMCAERKIPYDGFRQGLIWGETHDGNAHHKGGTAGNAGLFATARAVYRIARAIVKGELFPRELLVEATRKQTSGLDENRGLGWQLSQRGHAATDMLSERAFGHTGFTGTSIWIDPDAEKIMILLTNRVHPCANQIAMQRIRGEFHRLALEMK
jgi:CubicO group peptidase (beta-lactamase class C family)